MRASTAIKKDVLTGKLSTTGRPRADKVPEFDSERLVQELLSLGHKKITPRLAQTLSQEVGLELKRRPAPQVTPELISELVKFKLEELGVLEIKPPPLPAKKNKDKDNDNEETAALFPEETGSEAPWPAGQEILGFRAQKTQLKTLEKWIRSDKNARPCPPRAELKLSERAQRRLQGRFPKLEGQALQAELEMLFQNVAGQAAQAEPAFPQGEDPQTVAVQFFNAMCNLEFLPHHPTLTGAAPAAGSGLRQVWMDLPYGPASVDTALLEAQTFWQRGIAVSFRLESISAEQSFTPETFEKFLESLEGVLLKLPGESFLPAVGLQLNLADPQAPEFIATALSGKFYPKFHFVLACPPQTLRILNTDPDMLEESGRQRREALEKILKDTWKKSEPSLAFLERTRPSGTLVPRRFRESLLAGGGPVVGPGESSQLGSLNLSILAAGDDVDWGKLRRMVRSAVHFLDNLIETTEYPCEASAQMARTQRKIGLGVMGFAELLIKLGLPYDSDDAAQLGEKVMRFIYQEAAEASRALAERRGITPDPDAKASKPRNACLTAVVAAPFPALLADVTPGIEALEAVVEAQLDWNSQSLKLSPLPLLKYISERRKIWDIQLEAEILGKASVRNCEEAPKPLRQLFATGAEISVEWHLKIQGAFQKHCDGAVGKTSGLEEKSSWENLKDALRLCEQIGVWQLELKQNPSLGENAEVEAAPSFVEILSGESLGAPLPPLDEQKGEVPETAGFETLGSPPVATVFELSFPDAEETTPIENLERAEAKATEFLAEIAGTIAPQPEKIYPDLQPRPRPEVLQAVSRILQTGYGPMCLILGRDALGPYDLKAQLGKSGSREAAEAEALARLTSLLLSTGIDIRRIAEELGGIRAPQTAVDRGEEILSCADAISKFLERELSLKEQNAETSAEEEITVVTDIASLN